MEIGGLSGAQAARALLRRCRGPLLYAAAYLWRGLLWRTTFVGVTGSVGKTTTRECVAAALASHFRTTATRHNQNDRLGVPRTLLRVRPWDDYAVVEVATDGPGLMRRSARLLRPHVAVVLAVAHTHANRFATLDETATEKAQLLAALPPGGLAVLNADDDRVRGMAAGCRCTVRTFGRSAAADVRGDAVSSCWPARLTLRAHAAGVTQQVDTRLVGEHWVSAVLAALSVGLAAGIPLHTAAAALARVQPFAGRMQPVVLPCGATLIRDEENGSPDTVDAALRLLREAGAERRVLVMSDISDSRHKTRTRLRLLGRIAAQAADVAVFVGPHSHHAVAGALAAGMPADRVTAIGDLRAAAAHLRSELRRGDLVLLKGRSTDHLSRIAFAQLGEVACWRATCEKRIVCDVCAELQARPLPAHGPDGGPPPAWAPRCLDKGLPGGTLPTAPGGAPPRS